MNIPESESQTFSFFWNLTPFVSTIFEYFEIIFLFSPHFHIFSIHIFSEYFALRSFIFPPESRKKAPRDRRGALCVSYFPLLKMRKISS